MSAQKKETSKKLNIEQLEEKSTPGFVWAGPGGHI